STGTSGTSARKLIREMWSAGRYVTSICMGTGVVADTDVLKKKNAVGYPKLSAMIENKGAIWVDQPVVVDEPFITARTPEDAERFAETLLQHLRKKASR